MSTIGRHYNVSYVDQDGKAGVTEEYGSTPEEASKTAVTAKKSWQGKIITVTGVEPSARQYPKPTNSAHQLAKSHRDMWLMLSRMWQSCKDGNPKAYSEPIRREAWKHRYALNHYHMRYGPNAEDI